MVRHTLGYRLIIVIGFFLVSVGCGGAKKRSGTLCQDDSGCSGAQICLGGTCVATTVCSNNSECSGGVCYDGHCWSEQCGDDTQCADYLQCIEGYCVRKAASTEDVSEPQPDTTKDTSSETQCTTNAECVGKVGNLGECEEAVCQSGNCVKGYKAADSLCSDGNNCTSGDKCDGSGVCQPGTNTCACQTDDECKQLDDSCNKGYCDLLTNTCQKNAINEAQSCEDGDVCTAGETCQKGLCTGGTNPCVDTADACKKTAVCAPKTGGGYTCDYSAQDKTSCDDKSSCTTTDTCDKGVCVGSGNPCAVDSDPCRKNAVCNKLTDTTHSCDFMADNGVACVDGLECTASDACDGTTGTCRGVIVPLLTGCTLPDKSAGICGFYGDCTSVVSTKVNTPQDTRQYLFQALCDPGNGKALYPTVTFVTDSQQAYYGSTNVAVHMLSDGKLEVRATVDAYDRVYTNPQRYHCLGDKLVYARIEQFTDPQWYTDATLGVLYYDATGDQWLRETTDSKKTFIDDKFKNWLNASSGVYLNDTWSASRIADSYYFTLSGDQDSQERLLVCTDSYTDPGDVSCDVKPFENLPSGQGSFVTVASLGLPSTTADPDLMFLSSTTDSTMMFNSWTFTAYRGGKFSTSCDGSVSTAPCHNSANAPDYYNVLSQMDFTGFRSIAGATFANLYVVGGPRFPVWDDATYDERLRFNPPCTDKNAELVCASGACNATTGTCTDGPADRVGRIAHFNGSKWTSIAVPAGKLLREGGIAKVAFYDYVFDNAIYLDKEKTLLIAGHYRACTDPKDASNCLKKGVLLNLVSRPFLLAYDEATKTFSKMAPFGTERTISCCDGGSALCVSGQPTPLPPCSLNQYSAALSGNAVGFGLLRKGNTAQLYVLENTYAPRSCTDSDTSNCTSGEYCSYGYCYQYDSPPLAPVYHSLLSGKP
ncbi:MAG: hypothetical protein KC609_23125 [Myxococcales bacterium]|nr:hypothetical protein [Myxococcales bacterium]